MKMKSNGSSPASTSCASVSRPVLALLDEMGEAGAGDVGAGDFGVLGVEVEGDQAAVGGSARASQMVL
jgi:hypothetical protein